VEKYSNKCYKSVTLFVFLNIYNNCRLKGAHYIHNWNMFKNQNDDIVCALIWTSAGGLFEYTVVQTTYLTRNIALID